MSEADAANVDERAEPALVKEAGDGDRPAPQGSEHARLDDLADIIAAYNRVTENLQHSHEALRSEVLRLQRELASTDAQLQRSKRLAALGEMAAGIAHEIRNPLAAIHLYAQMLEDDMSALADAAADDPREGHVSAMQDAADTAHKIGSVVRGLNGIVTDVLTFARELRPRKAPVSVAHLFDRAIESQRPVLDAAGAAIRREGVDGSVYIDVDVEMVAQAMVNLVRNAAEALALAAKTRGVAPVLTLAARRDGEQIVITVRDNGAGIADEHIDRIFNPFFTTRDTGTGLGLAIVHRIIDAHGGAIAVQNDGGAVFELSLPAATVGGDDAAYPSARDEARFAVRAVSLRRFATRQPECVL